MERQTTMGRQTTVKKTKKQVMRQARNQEIIIKFKALREENPEVANERIFDTISRDYPIGNGAIRVIIKRAGLC